MKTKLETLKIPATTHKKVVVYCRKHGHKIYVWVSKLLLQALENSKNDK